MEGFGFVFVVAVAGVVAGCLSARRGKAKLRSQLQHVASELGLPLSLGDGGGWLRVGVSATLGGFEVSCKQTSHDRPLELVIDGQGAIPRRLVLGSESLLTTTLLSRDIELGLAAFDSEVRVTGDEVSAVALLDHGTRELVMRLVCGSQLWAKPVRVDEGRIKKKTSVGDFGSDLRNLMELALRLSIRPEELPERLERNATVDRFVSVRLRSLSLLQEKYPRSPEALRASRHALKQPNPNLRLAGALHLGEQGRGVVREIAQAEAVDEDLRATAIHRLATADHADEVIPILESLLASPRPQVVRAAIEGLGRLGHRTALPRLETLASVADPRTLAVLAETLRRLDDRAAEPCLLKLLAHDDDRVRLAAVRALDRVGTARAVEPLLELAEAGLLRRGLKTEARRAIAHIQSRLGDVEAGGLTLATPAAQEGGLSLSDDEQRGALSLGTEEPEWQDGS